MRDRADANRSSVSGLVGIASRVKARTSLTAQRER
jgi:hypothetical protein